MKRKVLSFLGIIFFSFIAMGLSYETFTEPNYFKFCIKGLFSLYFMHKTSDCIRLTFPRLFN